MFNIIIAWGPQVSFFVYEWQIAQIFRYNNSNSTDNLRLEATIIMHAAR